MSRDFFSDKVTVPPTFTYVGLSSLTHKYVNILTVPLLTFLCLKNRSDQVASQLDASLILIVLETISKNWAIFIPSRSKERIVDLRFFNQVLP